MTDSTAPGRLGRRRQARRGVSLIEVLVVLVILVLGILTIIRLFPSGFFSVESVGNTALADSLGIAAVQGQTQNETGLPDGILPGTMDVLGRPTATLAEGQYDPDKAGNLDNAHVVHNETITVPSARAAQSVYVVKYGPIQMGNVNPAGPVTQLSEYVAINGLPWTLVAGSATENPKDRLSLGQPNYLMDFNTGQIAVPYADYDQDFVLIVKDKNDQIATIHLTVPRDNLAGPLTLDQTAYLPSSATEYNGNWFDPTDTTTLKYDTDPPVTLAGPWKAALLYRPFHALGNTVSPADAFTEDPYEFKILNPNIVDITTTKQANVGAISFNPLGAGRVGVKPLQAQITYQNYSWRILHEDRDIPALPSGNTTITRLTLKNLRRVGDADADNTIDTGLVPGSNDGFIVQDLDTGLVLADTTPSSPKLIVDEDTNGTSTANLNVSYAVGRLTFPSAFFADTNAHRVRIYYAGDAGWTVAVQKASAYYTDATATAAASGILPGQFALDSSAKIAYFPQCEAGRTVLMEGTYMQGTTLKSFALTATIGDAIYPYAGNSYARVTLADTSAATPALPSGATSVTIGTVRGLSARAVVAWKERDRWKVHTVDTVLTRTP